jgi:beta-lactamase regulating signal transducer with metallopeptidase domain/protein involved in polysaccharide export with SLBB domain
MTGLFEIGLANAAFATVLAVVVWMVTRVWRHPVFVHSLWLVVLLKLITPPVVNVPWHFIDQKVNAAETSETLAVSAVDQAEMSTLVPSMGVDESNQFNDASAMDVPIEAIMIDATPPSGSPTPDLAEIEMDRNQVERQTRGRLRFPFGWASAAIIAWLAGTGYFALASTMRLLRFHRALSHAAPAPAELQRIAAELAARFGRVNRYRLRVSEGRLSPLVWPMGRPTIVMPRRLLAELAPGELETLLAHEFAHLCRRDHWVRWLELAVTTIYWWHPIVWWAKRAIQHAEEEACDAWVVSALSDSSCKYASALFKAAQFVSESRHASPAIASALGSKGNLKERIGNVMNRTWKPRLWLPVRLSVLLVAVLTLPLSIQAVRATDESAPTREPATAATDEATAQDAAGVAPGQVDAEIDATSDAQRVSADVLDEALANQVPLPDSTSDAAAQNQTDAGESAGVPFLKDIEHIGPLFRTQTGDRSDSAATEDRSNPKSQTNRIQPGMLLRVHIVSTRPGADDLPIDAIYTVAPNGSLSLGPILGRFSVAGMSTGDAAAAMQERLAKVIADPRIDVTPIAEKGPSSDGTYSQDSYRIAPLDSIRISVMGAGPDAPIQGQYWVEQGGTVALGPAYGRVKVAGMTIEDAEKALLVHLREYLRDPKVQVTAGLRNHPVPFLNHEPQNLANPWATSINESRSAHANVSAPGENTIESNAHGPTNDAAVNRATDAAVRWLNRTSDSPTTPVTDAAARWLNHASDSPTSPSADTTTTTPRRNSPSPTSAPTTSQDAPPTASHRDELDPLREHVKFLDEHAKKTAALFQAGTRGGSAYSNFMAAYELAVAQGELALAEGHRDEAAKRFEQAENLAEQALTAVRAAYDANQITDESLLQAAKNLSEIKRRLIQLRRPAESLGMTPSPEPDVRGRAYSNFSLSTSTPAVTESIGVLKKIVERSQADYRRMQDLAKKGTVSAFEVAGAKSEYEISIERLKQGERALRFYRAQVEVAEAELQKVADAHQTTPGAVSHSDLRHAELMVELAKAKLEELAE